MKIVCFGDSNTYGYDPRSYFGGRYADDICWVNILAKELGCQVINAGENGREVPHNNWELAEFTRLMEMEEPIDLLLIMLGTNDILQGNRVPSVVNRMENFLQKIDFPRSSILLIAPPILKLGEWVNSQEMIDATKLLSEAYKRLSERLCVNFVNAGEWNLSMIFDGVHLSEEGHRALADGILRYLRKGE